MNLLADHFICFRDEAKFDGRTVRILKRAQIFVADLWAAFEGEGYGEFHDIDTITMFAGELKMRQMEPWTESNLADYRIPQMLNSLDCISYSPPLDRHIRKGRLLEAGTSWEVQLRGEQVTCSLLR